MKYSNLLLTTVNIGSTMSCIIVIWGIKSGFYSRSVNIQHRMIYEVDEDKNSQIAQNVDILWVTNLIYLKAIPKTIQD